MGSIDLFVPQMEPTICGPVSDFKELTLASNAITMGWLGVVAGIVTSLVVAFAIFYVAPRVFRYGKTAGWWS